ncbi:MAG: hypothetical protein WB445_10835 [Acinetobacter sp.]
MLFYNFPRYLSKKRAIKPSFLRKNPAGPACKAQFFQLKAASALRLSSSCFPFMGDMRLLDLGKILNDVLPCSMSSTNWGGKHVTNVGRVILPIFGYPSWLRYWQNKRLGDLCRTPVR